MQTLSNWYNKAKAGTLVGTQQYSPDFVALLKENKSTYPTMMMAKLLKFSLSIFYDLLKRNLSKRIIQRNQLTILVKIAHQETRESYGHIR